MGLVEQQTDIKVTTHHLSGYGDGFELSEVAGTVNGIDTTLYLWRQTSWSGDGMSTSALTRTAAAAMNRPNREQQLREFANLQGQFDASSQDERKDDRFSLISESRRFQKLFELARVQDKVNDGSYTYTVSH